MPMRCVHKERKKVTDRRWHCSDCGKDFTPRGLLVKHGTVEGWNKHHKVRKGNWGWPACEKCVEGKKTWRNEYDNRPSSVQARRVRTAARAAALETVRRQYPAAYANAYLDEMARRQQKVVRQHYEVPEWESIIEKLIMAVTGLTEVEAEERFTHRVPLEQREVVRQIRRLRVVLATRFPDDKVGPANVHGLKTP